jgi:hypothetical protein
MLNSIAVGYKNNHRLLVVSLGICKMPGRLQQVRKMQKSHLCGQLTVGMRAENNQGWKKKVVQVGAVKSVSRCIK